MTYANPDDVLTLIMYFIDGNALKYFPDEKSRRILTKACCYFYSYGRHKNSPDRFDLFVGDSLRRMQERKNA